MSSLSRNIFSHASSTALGSLIQFFLIVVIAHFLKITEFGRFTVITASIAILEIVSDLGLRVLIIQFYSVDDEQKNKEAFTYAMTIKIGVIILLCLMVFLTQWSLFTKEELLLGVLIASLQPGTDPYLWFLRGRERLDLEAKIVVIWRLLNAILLAIIAYVFKDISLLLWAWLFSNGVRIIIERNVIKKLFDSSYDYLSLQLHHLQRDQLISILKGALPIGISLLLMAFYIRMNLIIIGSIGSATDVALYGAAFTIVVSAGFIGTSITIATFPALVRAIEKKNFDKAHQIIYKKLNMISLIIGSGCLLGIALAPWIVKLFYPEEYAKSADVMIWLFPGLYLSTLNFALKYLLNALYLSKKEILSVFVGMGTLIILLYFLNKIIPHLFLSAAIAWSLSELAMFSTKIIQLQQNSHLRIKRANIALYVLVYCLMLLFAFLRQT